MDYNEYDKEKDDEDAKPVKSIVVKDEVSGSVLSYGVLCKGPRDEWLLKRLVKDLKEWGRNHIILKTDGEPAIVAVQDALQRLRSGRTIPQNPPAYNSESNGACEKAVQDVAAHSRTLKLALEARLGQKIDEDAAIIQWVIPHAAYLLSRYSVGRDGMTPHERLTGRKWRRPMVEFGEVVMAKLTLRKIEKGRKKRQKRKLAARAVRGVWVGQIGRTGEHIVIKGNGDTIRCGTIKRVPIEDRWIDELVMKIEATPRRPTVSGGGGEELGNSVVDDEANAPHERPVQRRERRQAEAPDQNSGVGLEQPASRAPREDDIRRLRINDGILAKY